MSDNKDTQAIKFSTSSSADGKKTTMLAGDTGNERLQIFSARADGKTESIASFNPQHAPSRLKKKLDEEELDRQEEEAVDLAADEAVLALTPSNAPSAAQPEKMSALVAVSTIVSALWVGFCVYYMVSVLGANLLAQAQLYEIGGLFAMALSPLALLWLIVSNLQRKNDVNFYAQNLKSELHSILFPTQERAQYVHKDIQQLVDQSAQLAASTKAVLKSIARARQGLRVEMREFATLAKKGEVHISNLSGSLQSKLEETSQFVDNIEKRFGSLETLGQTNLSNWQAASEMLVSKAEVVESKMTDGTKVMLDAANTASTQAAAIQDSFAESVKSLNNRIDRANDTLEMITAQFDDQVSRLESSGMEIADSTRSLSQDVETQIEEIRSATQEATSFLATSRETMSANVVLFDKAVKTLSTTTDQANDLLNDKLEDFAKAGESIDSKITAMGQKVDGQALQLVDSVKGLNRFVDTIEKTGSETVHKLSEAISSAVISTENLTDSIRKNAENLDETTKGVETRTKTLLETASESTTRLSAKEDEFVKKLSSYKTLVDEQIESFDSTFSKGDTLSNTMQEKLDTAKSQYTETMEGLETRLNAFSTTLKDPLAQVSSRIKDIEQAETTLNVTFEKRIAELTEANTKTVISAQKIRDMLKGQAQEIATLSGQIVGQVATAEESLLSQKSSLEDVFESNTQLISQATETLKAQQENVAQYCEKTQASFDGLNNTILVSYNELDEVQADAEKSLESLVSRVVESKDILVEANQEANDNLNAIYTNLSEVIEKSKPIYEGYLEDSRAVQTRFEELESTASTVVSTSVASIVQASDCLSGQIATIDENAKQAQETLSALNDTVLANNNVIATTVKSAQDETETLLKGFENCATDIHLVVDEANLKIDSVQKSLTEQLSALSDYVGQSIAGIGSAEQGFEKASSVLLTTIEKAHDGYANLRSSVMEEAKILADATEEKLNQTKDVLTSLRTENSALLNQSSETVSTLQKLTDTINIRVEDVERQLEATLRTSDKYTANLRDQASAVAEAAHDSVDKITGSIAVLKDQSKNVASVAHILNEDIGKASEHLKSHAKNLKNVSEAAVLVSSEASNNFAEHTQKLQNASEEAMAHVKKIREAEAKFERGAFLGSAKFIMESLHSVTVDIMRHIKAGQIDERDMKAFEKGDLTIFTKRLVEIGERFPDSMVRDKFTSDTQFRTYVQRYLRQFEELFEQAQENDHGGIMSATFMSSEIGKLYLMLCKAVGRSPRGIVTH
ncbi:MAG: hypothetical protein CMH30_03020 [Micavibrio sp.]|nr:hypothetical protein [Micavibrio sp.]